MIPFGSRRRARFRIVLEHTRSTYRARGSGKSLEPRPYPDPSVIVRRSGTAQGKTILVVGVGEFSRALDDDGSTPPNRRRMTTISSPPFSALHHDDAGRDRRALSASVLASGSPPGSLSAAAPRTPPRGHARGPRRAVGAASAGNSSGSRDALQRECLGRARYVEAGVSAGGSIAKEPGAWPSVRSLRTHNVGLRGRLVVRGDLALDRHDGRQCRPLSTDFQTRRRRLRHPWLYLGRRSVPSRARRSGAPRHSCAVRPSHRCARAVDWRGLRADGRPTPGRPDPTPGAGWGGV